jgi:hypothetical protein
MADSLEANMALDRRECQQPVEVHAAPEWSAVSKNLISLEFGLPRIGDEY